ncbi:MAG: methyltransferase domain-containing protein [Anaerolineales bacterium]|nr:methyltransferase domain-containing protein [Anaerolineales bacterium]
MPLESDRVDMVWAHAVMEHVHPRRRACVLPELWRVHRPGGLLVVNATSNRLWFREGHTFSSVVDTRHGLSSFSDDRFSETGRPKSYNAGCRMIRTLPAFILCWVFRQRLTRPLAGL